MLPIEARQDATIVTLATAEVLEQRLHERLLCGQLPDAYLYVGRGASNWLALEHSPAFDVASSLTELLRQNVASLVPLLPEGLELMSIGVGEGLKERILLKALASTACKRYLPVDVSEQLVEAALGTVADLDLPKLGIVAFAEDLPSLRQYRQGPSLLCLLGNNFSNYQPEELLAILSKEMDAADYLLFDSHLCPDGIADPEQWRRSVEAVYRQEQNADFNLSPLVQRGVPRENCRFRLDLLHLPSVQGPVYRTVKQIEILRDCATVVGGRPVDLHAGEHIEMGFTYKYRARQVEGHLREKGFSVVWKASASGGENAVFLCRKEQG